MGAMATLPAGRYQDLAFIWRLLCTLVFFCADWQLGPKVILLEFATVRCGSHEDLACEEAPEICAHLEPLPSPRKDPQCKLSTAQDSSCIKTPWEKAARACMPRQPMPAGVPGSLGIVTILASSLPRAIEHTHNESGSPNRGANAMYAVHVVRS